MSKLKPRWLFVDDTIEEAKSFAHALSTGNSPIDVVVMNPTDAKDRLLSKEESPTGVLMDVDLSNAPGVKGTGPGIAQDLRVKQRAGEVDDYPIVRFAGVANVRKNVGGDPSSDDLFDWKVMKEQVTQDGPASVWQHLQGIDEVYRALPPFKERDRSTFPELVGLTAEDWEKLGHPAFADRIMACLQVATHVAAGTFVRSFLLASGLLIDETLLAVRLGVDKDRSGNAWSQLRSSFAFDYRGAGRAGFVRWWARGLDEWWARTTQTPAPLSSLDIQQRIATLAKLDLKLVPLEMPKGSAGGRPWRLCTLSLERQPPVLLPLDPAESVRMTGTTDLPSWVDPRYAALAPAQQERKDFRLNTTDLNRLKLKHK